MRLPIPMCGLCGKPVAEMLSVRNEDARRTLVRVQCHGQKSEMEIDDIDFALAIEFLSATAFDQKLALQ